eukprot:gene13771-biopygen17046
MEKRRLGKGGYGNLIPHFPWGCCSGVEHPYACSRVARAVDERSQDREHISCSGSALPHCSDPHLLNYAALLSTALHCAVLLLLLLHAVQARVRSAVRWACPSRRGHCSRASGAPRPPCCCGGARLRRLGGAAAAAAAAAPPPSCAPVARAALPPSSSPARCRHSATMRCCSSSSFSPAPGTLGWPPALARPRAPQQRLRTPWLRCAAPCLVRREAA